MIKGAPRAVMFAFFGMGIALTAFSGWALNTEIPQEQFQEDPRFEEEYIKYHQWLLGFSASLLVAGGIIAYWGRKM